MPPCSSLRPWTATLRPLSSTSLGGLSLMILTLPPSMTLLGMMTAAPRSIFRIRRTTAKAPPGLVRAIGRGTTGEAAVRVSAPTRRGGPMVSERRHQDGDGRREHGGALPGAAGRKMSRRKWRLALGVELDDSRCVLWKGAKRKDVAALLTNAPSS